jgi:hypothetical protein
MEMSAGLDLDSFGNKGGETTKRCSVVSIYENVGDRDLLLKLCNSVARRFEDDLEFQFEWWRFKYLADPELAMEAARSAAQADLILLAAQSPELPVEVQTWFEGWLPNREAADGALVLVQPSSTGSSRSFPLRSYLRRTAKRGRLDYLRLMFQPDFSALLDETDRPLHWGINE